MSIFDQRVKINAQQALITVNALDRFNTVNSNYSGKVHVTSSDGAATLPQNFSLSGGTATFFVTLQTLDNQTL
jgi:hypothetical protein